MIAVDLSKQQALDADLRAIQQIDFTANLNRDVSHISHVDVSNFTLKSNLASLKTEVDKLYIDKLLPGPNDLAKLSNVVKKIEYKKLVTQVDNVDTKNFVKKTNMKKMDQILKTKSIR